MLSAAIAHLFKHHPWHPLCCSLRPQGGALHSGGNQSPAVLHPGEPSRAHNAPGRWGPLCWLAPSAQWGLSSVPGSHSSCPRCCRAHRETVQHGPSRILCVAPSRVHFFPIGLQAVKPPQPSDAPSPAVFAGGPRAGLDCRPYSLQEHGVAPAHLPSGVRRGCHQSPVRAQWLGGGLDLWHSHCACAVPAGRACGWRARNDSLRVRYVRCQQGPGRVLGVQSQSARDVRFFAELLPLW